MIILKLFGMLIFIVVIFILMIALSAAFSFWNVFRQITGKGKQPFGQQNNSQNQWYNPSGHQNDSQGQWYNPSGQQNSQHTSSTQSTVSGKPKPRNSAIDKNEGEYVDFEEIP